MYTIPECIAAIKQKRTEKRCQEKHLRTKNVNQMHSGKMYIRQLLRYGQLLKHANFLEKLDYG